MILLQQDLFKTFTIVSVKETTLGGNQWFKDMNRLKWDAETNDILYSEEQYQPVEIKDGIINIILKPMEIRTFILKIVPKRLNKIL